MLKWKVEQISSSKATFKAFTRNHDSIVSILVYSALLKKMIRVIHDLVTMGTLGYLE